METLFSANSAFSAEIYSCQFCHTICSKKNDWARHLLTKKHIRNTTGKMETNNSATEFRCKCGKQYNSKSGLWKHTKICTYKPAKTQFLKNEPLPTDVTFLTNLVLEVVKNNSELQKQNSEYQKQNHEFQKQMLEVCKKGNNINTNNSYNNNKTFNLQFFLNEQCKDAMNLTEFIDTMTLEFSDLEDVGKLGYVEGISKIMIRKLNELDIYKRPIHCSDSKREIMYVKEHNVWGKEKNSNEHIRKAIKKVTHKNGGLLVPWSLENPNCMNLDHHLNDVYLRMMGQSMGGSGEFFDNENKIMKKIAKAVFIDKM